MAVVAITFIQFTVIATEIIIKVIIMITELWEAFMTSLFDLVLTAIARVKAKIITFTTITVTAVATTFAFAAFRKAATK